MEEKFEEAVKMVSRRNMLRGGALMIGAAAAAPLLASCAAGGGSGTATSSGAAATTAAGATKTNPFAVPAKANLDAVIFKGGYGIDYVEFSGKVLSKMYPGGTVKIAPSTQIAQELQPRFAGGNPPDLVDNSGANSIPISSLIAQVEDLAQVINANNVEGTPIKDTLFEGVLEPGTFNGKLAAINYAMTVYALWYSESLMTKNGWTVPKTWDEMLELGAKAKEKNLYLFSYGKEAATYYLELAITMAIKEAGDEVRLAVDNQKDGCWSLPAITKALEYLEKIVKAGYVEPGGSGMVFTAAQAEWTGGKSIFYPSGSWIENEMKSQTDPSFKMTGTVIPLMSGAAKLPLEALHSTAGEPFMVPSKGKNKAEGLELLRIMLSKESATNFAKTKLAPTIIKDTVPADGFGSSALVSQIKMIEAAGKNIFSWSSIDFTGVNKDFLVPWNSFLDGKLSSADLAKAMQGFTNAAAKLPQNKRDDVK